MLIISSRKEFWSATEFSDTDEARDVRLLNPDPSVDTPVSETELVSRIRDKRVLLLVHGYNNTEDDVNLAYDRIERSIARYSGSRYDVVMGYTWPGGALGISYPIARARSNSAAPRFAAWIRKIGRAAASLDVMTHSLGSRVGLKALGEVSGRPVRHLLLFAAAVDNESIERGEDFHDATKRCEGVLVIHSKKDKTLRVWYRIGDAILPWQWGDLFDAALGYSGPEDPAAIIQHSKNVTVANGKNAELDHGDYKDNPKVFAFVDRYLAGKTTGQFYTL